MRRFHLSRKARGVSMILFVALLPVVAGMMSVGVDFAVVATAEAQLGAAADAGALAGANTLANEATLSTTFNGWGGLMSQAANSAQTYAQDNNILNQQPVFLPNSANSPGGDIVVGYVNPATNTWYPPPGFMGQYNSVMVNVSRNAQHGGVVPGFFSRILGFHGSSITAQSIGTVVNDQVLGFSPSATQNASLLPIVLDTNTYQLMIENETTDQYTYNVSQGTVTSGPDGVYESVLYPVSNNDPGNWGTIKVNTSNNSTATLVNQIENGINLSSSIQLDSTTGTYTFSGNPGISAGIKGALESIIGQPRVIPIYTSTSGNGNNATYTVNQFAVVRIVAVNFQGNPKYVIVQPALTRDPNIIRGGPQTTWSAGGYVHVYLSH
jgi:hypothetical protein